VDGRTDGHLSHTLLGRLGGVYLKSGQSILTKGRIACRAVIEDWMIPFAACRY